MEGTIIGRYRLIRKLGAGGMAEVYLAKHELMDCYAAVKLLLPEMSVRDGIVKRFFQEAQAAACIEHPGIVHVFDVGYAANGRAYLAMELLSGETLGRRLKRQQRLSLDETLVIIRQLAGVIGAAHQRGIIHRDLKPDNVFLVRDPEIQHGERVKVLDFGLAKLLESSVPTAGLTAQDAVFGTPGYMAPEQCRSSANVDARADLYAIGCVFYACLCGRPPFGNGGLDVLMAHIGQSPVAPRWHATTIPPAVDALILRLLEKDPTRRLASCEALIAELDHALRDATDARHGNGSRRSSEPLVNDDGVTIRDDFLPEDAFMLLEDHESLARHRTACGRPGLPGLPPPPEPPMPLPLSETRHMRPLGRPATDRAERFEARPALMLTALPVAIMDESGRAEQRPIEATEDNSPSRGSMPTMGNGELGGHLRRSNGRRILWSLAGVGLVGGLMAAWVSQAEKTTKQAVEPGPAVSGSAIDGGLPVDATLQERAAVASPEVAQQAHAKQRSQPIVEQLRDGGGWKQVAQIVEILKQISASMHHVDALTRDEASRIEWHTMARERAQELLHLGDCDALAALVEDAARQFPEVHDDLTAQSAACTKTSSDKAKPSIGAGKRKALKMQIFADAQKAYEADNIVLASALCRDAWKVADGDENVAAFCGIVACKLKSARIAKRYYVHAAQMQHRGWIAQTCLREGIDVQE
jgi:serine/threonine protein kinase